MRQSYEPAASAESFLSISGQVQASAGERMTDLDLVRGMAKRDEAALGMLYDRWSALVYSVAAKFLEPEDAEEVLEDTFWQAWRQAEQYRDGRGKVATWLIVIARSRALDRRKKSRRTLALLEAQGTEAVGASSCCPLSDALSSEEQRRVLQAIGMLPPEQQETIRLAYYGDLSHRQIAAQLGQPLGTVKTRARLAIGKLKQYLSVLRDPP